MSVYVLLDVLLIILIALFIPIGFWRGAYREAFVTLGVLFGAALANVWGEPWGTDLASFTRLHESGGAFMVAMMCLIGSTFLLGYGAGAAVPVLPPGWVVRSFGALLAAMNGALLLSFALRDIRVYLLDGEDAGFLDRAVIAPFLSDGVGWLLLIGAALFVPVVLVMALFGRPMEYVPSDYYDDEDEFVVDETPGRGHETVRSRTGDFAYAAYKTEGPPSTTSPSEETLPLRPYQSRITNGHTSQREESTDEQATIESSPSQSSDDQETIQIDTLKSESDRSALDEGKCPDCHADVSDAEVYCPSCGRVL